MADFSFDIVSQFDRQELKNAVDQATARVASADAQLKIAQLTLDRAKEAMSQQAATQQEVDQKQAMRDSARADVELANAQLAKAKLDLEFTQIRSPIDGRLGIVTVDPGQLVGAGDATLLFSAAGGLLGNDSGNLIQQMKKTFGIDLATYGAWGQYWSPKMQTQAYYRKFNELEPQFKALPKPGKAWLRAGDAWQAAMATLIVVCSGAVCLLLALVSRGILPRSQRWRSTERH